MKLDLAGTARVAAYAAALALGALVLQQLDLQAYARGRPGELYMLLVAAGFLGLGVFLGARLFVPPPAGAPKPAEAPAARTALGLSDRELEVLREIAEGRSNKEIARRLGVAPDTVKTHAANLYRKLGAARRTAAVARARTLGLLG